MKHIFLAALCLALGACTSTIEMRNVATGQVAKCGPYATGVALGGYMIAERERQCISDFQRQGYERVSD